MSEAAQVEMMTRIDVPMAPEPTWEDLVQLWIDQRRQVDFEHFKLGIIAAKVESVYGERNIAEFAKDVKEKPSEVYRHLRVYREFAEYFQRWKNLSWSHFVIAAESGLDLGERERLLLDAANGDWSTPQLKREVMLRRSAKILSEAPTADPEIAQALAEWKDLKPRIEKFARHPQFALLAHDFLGGVDDELDRPWDSAREFLERQIELGARETESLCRATGFQKETVEAMCDELTATGEYRYLAKGGSTEMARGARVRLIVPASEPSGDAYESRRSPYLADDDWPDEK